ncbi:MAG: hypothetical protein OXC07_08305 [Kistimonas sp.]|nr:hypothetical protein [Kistimonas sp.]
MLSSVAVASLAGSVPDLPPVGQGTGKSLSTLATGPLAPAFSGYLAQALCQGIQASSGRLAPDSPLSLSSTLPLVQSLLPYLSAYTVTQSSRSDAASGQTTGGTP